LVGFVVVYNNSQTQDKSTRSNTNL